MTKRRGKGEEEAHGEGRLGGGKRSINKGKARGGGGKRKGGEERKIEKRCEEEEGLIREENVRK